MVVVLADAVCFFTPTYTMRNIIERNIFVRNIIVLAVLLIFATGLQLPDILFSEMLPEIHTNGTSYAAEHRMNASPEYHFDSTGISRQVLENYLKHSITLTSLLEAPSLAADTGGLFPDKEDDIRLVRNIGAKLIGRVMYRWGREDVLNNPLYRDEAKRIAAIIHESDPDIVLQAFLCEIVTPRVNDIKIPGWAFAALGLAEEDRNFYYDDMLALNGRFVNHWGTSSVPDVSRTETKLWFTFLAGYYMEIGCEAFHLGQVNLMNMNDPDFKHWAELIGHIRALAEMKIRRGWVILDAHTPRGHMVVDGKSLLDFNSFPLRIKEVAGKPTEGILEAGYSDSLYKRSQGGVTPSGWECDSLPYLVEFDNFGISRTPGESTLDSHYIWGYDEISWFYLLGAESRAAWLKYAYDWLRETDPSGFLQMPAGRLVTLPTPEGGSRVRARFRANPPSETIPDGKGLEDVIKELWR